MDYNLWIKINFKILLILEALINDFDNIYLNFFINFTLF